MYNCTHTHTLATKDFLSSTALTYLITYYIRGYFINYGIKLSRMPKTQVKCEERKKEKRTSITSYVITPHLIECAWLPLTIAVKTVSDRLFFSDFFLFFLGGFFSCACGIFTAHFNYLAIAFFAHNSSAKYANPTVKSVFLHFPRTHT